MPQGSRGHIGIKKETTWGEKVAGANDLFLPFASETLTENIEELLSAAQRGILDEPKSYQGEKSFGGDVVIEAHPTSIGHILRSALNVPAEATAAGTTETELCSCEAAWTPDEGVVASVDPNDKKKGTYSARLQVTPSVAPDDILGSFIVSANMVGATHIKFWIKCSKITADGDLVLRVSENALGANTPEAFEDMNVPILAAGVWQECTVVITDATDLAAVISVALIMHIELADFEVRLDDIRYLIAGASTTAKQHIFTPRQATDFHADCPINPYTLEVYRDQGNAFQFLGAIVNTLALNFSTTDKVLKATCGIIAKNIGSVSKTGLSLEATKPFVWQDAKIYIGGVADPGNRCNDLESFSLTWDNKCVAKYFLNNTAIPGKIIRDGFRTIPVSFVIDFVNRTEYDYFILGTERQFRIKLVGAVCDATPEPDVYYTLQIDLPLVRYLAYPINIGGPGRLTCAVTGKAKYDAAGYALLATLINLKDTAEYAA